jgi:hypothetical protein
VMALRKLKAMVLVFALVVLVAGAVTIVSTDTVTASNCCWVMVCTIDEPIICWHECVPCPPLPPPPWP